MKLKLHWQIAIALVLGVAFGFLSRIFGFENLVTEKIAVFGTLFRRGLQMIIVPLIVSSIISGVTSIGTGQNLGRMGAKTFAYYITTSLLAILVGLILVNIFAPGVGANVGFQETPADLASNVQKIGDTLIGIIPTNPVTAMAQGDMLPTIFFSLLFG
ncbi:MAG: dicarboxylate/amino acid:cation symporter, partial [bacterium]